MIIAVFQNSLGKNGGEENSGDHGVVDGDIVVKEELRSGRGDSWWLEWEERMEGKMTKGDS